MSPDLTMIKHKQLNAVSVTLVLVLVGSLGFFISRLNLKISSVEHKTQTPLAISKGSLSQKAAISQDEPAHWKTYKSQKYGYELRYPNRYSLKKFIDWHGKEREETIELLTEVDSPIIIDIDLTGAAGNMSFHDYVIKFAQSWCVADGPDGGVHCPHIVKERSFINPDAIPGHEVYFTEVRTYTNSEKTETRVRGPIFAFDISNQTGGKAKGLFINLRGNKVDEAIVRQMISTLRF